MDNITALVVAYLPSLVSVVSIIAAVIKIVKENVVIDKKIQEVKTELKEDKEAKSKENTQLKNAITTLMQENARLKKQNLEILQKLTGIKPKE